MDVSLNTVISSHSNPLNFKSTDKQLFNVSIVDGKELNSTAKKPAAGSQSKQSAAPIASS